MKKRQIILTLFLSISFVLSIATTVNAQQIGDVIGNTVYTDIIASINDYNIASYNINGYTAIVAEDLRNYGFDVQWNPNDRALYITRGGTNNVVSTYIAPKISSFQIGKKAQSVLYTDIKTYINGQEVTSYNIGGNTIVYFNDLGVFGGIEYNDNTRRLDLSINDGLNYKISAPHAYSQFTPSGLYFKMNSADGLQVRWFAYNNTNKTINYYTTTYYIFNPVGDFAYNRMGNNYFMIRTVGPIQPGEELLDFTPEYKAEIYYDAPIAEYIMLYSIFVEYSDGTSETIYYNHTGQRESWELAI